MRKLLLVIEARLFAAWLVDQHERNHPVEWVLYHSYQAVGRAADALRPRYGAR